MQVLVTPGGSEGRALGVNGAGQIVGSLTSPAGSRQACLWTAPRLIGLGTLPACSGSEATAINAAGQIVGVAWDDLGNRRAFVWSAGVLTDLNDLLPAGSGWTLEHASGIGDSGQVVGWGRFRERQRAFLLTLPPEPQGNGIRRSRDFRRVQ